MLNFLKKKIRKNFEVSALILLIIISTFSTSYFNFKKKNNKETYNNFIDNVYFKKTLIQIINNLEPKYKKIKHKIESGETFDKILQSYSINKDEIIKIKNALKKKVDLNKLNTRQIIQFNLDKQTKSKILLFKFLIPKSKFKGILIMILSLRNCSQ